MSDEVHWSGGSGRGEAEKIGERWIYAGEVGCRSGGADLARSGGGGEAEETRRRPGGREWRRG